MDDMEQPGGTQDSGAADTGVEDQNLGVEAGGDDQAGELGQDSQEQTGTEEFGEIEVDGKKFELPKPIAEKLQAERMMNADYTQKTQALAEQRRQFEAQSAEQQRQQQEYVQDYAKVVAIDDQLAAYNQLDWQELIANDPQQAMIYQQQQRTLESQRAQAIQAVTQKQQQFALNEQQAFAKRVQEANDYVQREIPGWSSGRDVELHKYVEANGVSKTVLGPLVVKHPALLKIIHKAELYDRQAKKATAKPAPPVQDKPVTRVGASRGAVQRDPSKMSDADWYRQRQEKQRKR